MLSPTNETELYICNIPLPLLLILVVIFPDAASFPVSIELGYITREISIPT